MHTAIECIILITGQEIPDHNVINRMFQLMSETNNSPQAVLTVSEVLTKCQVNSKSLAEWQSHYQTEGITKVGLNLELIQENHAFLTALEAMDWSPILGLTLSDIVSIKNNATDNKTDVRLFPTLPDYCIVAHSIVFDVIEKIPQFISKHILSETQQGAIKPVASGSMDKIAEAGYFMELPLSADSTFSQFDGISSGSSGGGKLTNQEQAALDLFVELFASDQKAARKQVKNTIESPICTPRLKVKLEAQLAEWDNPPTE